MKAPQALLLDAMGTLIGLRRSVGCSYAELAADFGLTLEPAAIDRVFPRIYRQAPPLAFPGLEGDALRQAELDWWGERIGASVAAASQTRADELPPGLVETLFERFADAALWQVYPEVPACIERWRSRPLKLAVVSNFDSRLPPLLADLGLAAALDALVVSSQVGAAKPDPAPFQRALQILQLEAHQVWHVGDSPEDELGARAAGIRCLMVRRP
jgi:putative hydrolase of the HAD superfamily